MNSFLSGSLKDIKPPNWCLTEDCNKYLARPNDDTDWVPEQEYYIKLIGRLVDNILLLNINMTFSFGVNNSV